MQPIAFPMTLGKSESRCERYLSHRTFIDLTQIDDDKPPPFWIKLSAALSAALGTC
jgi:hypothetical protein